ncbi:hypothetical protein FRB95_014203 [Tulasnella sp. JGI-2019a]|nr:hypothetical protein FRB95_014203 [Tulasnella sp. JGI-2019a]
MKKLAACDFEDLLQCSMPAFEGLFGVYDAIIQDCLFTLCLWHGLAKLRLHTDSMVHLLQKVTKDLGRQLCRFVQEVCDAVTTFETAKERAAQAQVKGTLPPKEVVGKNKKMFNLHTFKWHAIPDYPATILQFGMTDSYSTQTVCSMLSRQSDYTEHPVSRGNLSITEVNLGGIGCPRMML